MTIQVSPCAKAHNRDTEIHCCGEDWGTRRPITHGDFPQYFRHSLVFYLLTLNFSPPEERDIFIPRLHDVRCVQDKRARLLILLIGIAPASLPPYNSRGIICRRLSQVPHHAPLTGFVSSLIPDAAEECCLSRSWHSERASDRSETIRAFSFFFPFLSFLPPPVRPQHIAHFFLPSLSTWLNIVTSLTNYASPPVRLSLSPLLFLSPSLPPRLKYAFLHSPAAKLFKGQRF